MSSSSLDIVSSDFCFAASTSSSSDFLIVSILSMSLREFSCANSRSSSSDFSTVSANVNDFLNASSMSSSSDLLTGSDNDSANDILIILFSSSFRNSCLRYSSSNVSLLTLTAYDKASSSASVLVAAGSHAFRDASIPDCMCSMCWCFEVGSSASSTSICLCLLSESVRFNEPSCPVWDELFITAAVDETEDAGMTVCGSSEHKSCVFSERFLICCRSKSNAKGRLKLRASSASVPVPSPSNNWVEDDGGTEPKEGPAAPSLQFLFKATGCSPPPIPATCPNKSGSLRRLSLLSVSDSEYEYERLRRWEEGEPSR